MVREAIVGGVVWGGLSFRPYSCLAPRFPVLRRFTARAPQLALQFGRPFTQSADFLL